MSWYEEGHRDTGPRATDPQKRYIEILLEQTNTALEDYTEKDLDDLTVGEASEIIDSLKEMPREFGHER